MTHPSASGDANLLYTDVEDSLRDSVRDLLTARCTPDRVVATYDGDRSLVAGLWRALAVDLDLAGLLVPEDHGGSGGTAREAAVVLEELGWFAAPVPFLTSSVVATTALRHADRADHSDPADRSDPAARTLAGLTTGESTVALAVPLSASATGFGPEVTMEGGSLRGRVTSVAGALESELLLVPVLTEAGVELHLVDSADAGIEPVVCLDMTRQLADVDLTGATSGLVVSAGGGEAAVREALQLGAALLASEQLGVAQWCLDTTVAYLGDRKQFGRAVGGFQALKHRLADLYVRVESARAAARYAAATAADDDPDREVAASLAQAYCSEVAVLAAEECVQLHGGIAMTWEHPAHLYLKRAKADQIAFGTPRTHRRHLSSLINLPAEMSVS